MSLENGQFGPNSVKGRHYRWPPVWKSKADMRRNLIALGLAATVSACASTSLTTTRSTTEPAVKTATQAGILEALNGGLFARLDNGEARRSERMQALEAEYRALEHTPAGQVVPWRSEGSSLAGEVVAAQPYRVGSQDCRTYKHTVSQNGATATANGTACRNADGSWTPLT